jgi:predicted RNase H-like HicB family nuclease
MVYYGYAVEVNTTGIKESTANWSTRSELIDRTGDSVRQILLRPGDDGWWVAEVPSLPGAISQGKTREEAIANIREAIDLVEQTLRESGEPIPEDDLQAELVTVDAL